MESTSRVYGSSIVKLYQVNGDELIPNTGTGPMRAYTLVRANQLYSVSLLNASISKEFYVAGLPCKCVRGDTVSYVFSHNGKRRACMDELSWPLEGEFVFNTIDDERAMDAYLYQRGYVPVTTVFSEVEQALLYRFMMESRGRGAHRNDSASMLAQLTLTKAKL
jgi:hypothetical protein